MVFVLLGALILGHGFMDASWFSRDTAYRGNDAADYFQQYQNFARRVADEEGSFSIWLENMGYQEKTSAPPLLFVVTWFAAKWGKSPLSQARFSSSFAKILLILFTFLAASRLSNREGGLYAAISISFFSAVTVFSHQYNPILLTAAGVAAGVYFLLASDAFQRAGPSILFGAALGLTLLTERGTAPIFCAPLIGYGVFQAVAAGRGEARSVKLGIALHGGLALFIAGLISYRYLAGYLAVGGEHILDLATTPLRADRDHWYYLSKFGRLISGKVFWGIGLVFGTIFLLRSRDHRLLPVLVLVVPIAFFSLLATRDLEYVVSGVVGWALLVGGGFALLPWKRWRMGIMAVTAAAGLALALLASFPVGANWPDLGEWQKKEMKAGRLAVYFPRESPGLRVAAEKVAQQIAGDAGVLTLYGYKQSEEDKGRPGESWMHLLNILQIHVGFARPRSRHLILHRDLFPEGLGLAPGEIWVLIVKPGSHFHRLLSQRQDWLRFRAAVEVSSGTPDDPVILEWLKKHPPRLLSTTTLSTTKRMLLYVE